MRSFRILFLRWAMVGFCVMITSLTLRAADKPDGGDIYKKNCSMCHGVDGKGFSALKTPDFTDPKWQAAAKDKDVTTIIKVGKKDTAMKGFEDKLKPEEIQAVVAYIRSLNSVKKKN